MSSDDDEKSCSNAKMAAIEEPILNEKPYNWKEVWWQEVVYADGTQKPFNPMKIKLEERHKPVFCMPNHMDVSVNALSELYLSDKLLGTIANNSNDYAKMKGKDGEPITESEVLRFFAIILYMRVVNLPLKRDYWKGGSGLWPLTWV